MSSSRSAGSIRSIGSAGSLLSIGSAFSAVSVASALSVGSVLSVLAAFGAGRAVTVGALAAVIGGKVAGAKGRRPLAARLSDPRRVARRFALAR